MLTINNQQSINGELERLGGYSMVFLLPKDPVKGMDTLVHALPLVGRFGYRFVFVFVRCCIVCLFIAMTEQAVIRS